MIIKRHEEAWFALVVRPGRETDIKNNINGINEDELQVVDMVIPEPLEGRRKKEEEANRYKYFLGYVFIKINLTAKKINTFLKMEYVYRFLENVARENKNITSPAMIPDKQMQNLKMYLDGSGMITNKHSEFKIGDDVEIVSGDLHGIRGKIMSLSNTYAGLLAKKGFNQIIKVPVGRIAHSE